MTPFLIEPEHLPAKDDKISYTSISKYDSTPAIFLESTGNFQQIHGELEDFNFIEEMVSSHI